MRPQIGWLWVLISHVMPLHASSFLTFLNFTSPSPLIFHSLVSLLQVKPQTLFPNGHAIAPVTIPRHTVLYHGRHDNDPVPSPEWLAFDIEMAYGIMGNMQDSRMLSYRTTRVVRAVYFDGTSANLIGDGTTSQMVFIYNGTDDVPKRRWGPPRRPGHGDHGHLNTKDEDHPPRRPPGGKPPGGWNPLQDEYFRARELCKWLVESGLGGKGWGYEGIVRMNAGFELIWCDFESPSLKLVSNLNVSAPLSKDQMNAFAGQHQLPQEVFGITEDEGPHGPGMTDPRESFRNTSQWFWFSAAAKQYAGDSRIRVDSMGIFSFYEPGLRNQTQSRVADDIERLELGPDGRWKSRRSTLSQSPFSAEKSNRSEEWHNLLVRRRQHRLTTVDKQDGNYMRHAVEKRLRNVLATASNPHGIDWTHVAKGITNTYSDKLELLLHYLGQIPRSSDDHIAFEKWICKVRQLTHWFLLPFFEYPSGRPYAQEDLQELFGLRSALAHTTLERCMSQYDDDQQLHTTEDIIFSQAIKQTMHGICSTIIKIGLGVEYSWFLYFDSGPEQMERSKVDASNDLEPRVQEWKEEMEELVAWLGWAEPWSTCEKKCGVGEKCYIPMWPVSGWGGGGRWGRESEFLWNPVCVGMGNYPPEEWDIDER